MGFKHTGVFPEQAVNWDYTAARIRAAKEKNPEREIKTLNLFGYTGAATLACMEAGATVTHVDASKGMVQWARENAAASNLAERPVRWLVDDCVKFVHFEFVHNGTFSVRYGVSARRFAAPEVRRLCFRR